MDDHHLAFDYSEDEKPFEVVHWINITTGKKELVRVPIERSMRDIPLTKYHISGTLYNYWKEMDSCKIIIDSKD